VKLRIEPNLSDPDGTYAQLLALHEDRSDSESARVNARLILLLANHIGDASILREAIEIAGRERPV